jgi:hypothetical protein
MRVIGMKSKSQNPKERDKDAKMPAAGPHSEPDKVDESRTPGTGTLPKPGTNDPNDMAPTG